MPESPVSSTSNESSPIMTGTSRSRTLDGDSTATGPSLEDVCAACGHNKNEHRMSLTRKPYPWCDRCDEDGATVEESEHPFAPSAPSEDLPTVECPRCHDETPDLDGFGFVACRKCGLCDHPSVTGDLCDICGARYEWHLELPATSSSDLPNTPDRRGAFATPKGKSESEGSR